MIAELYDPAVPNVYSDVKYAQYVARKEAAAAAAAAVDDEQQRTGARTDTHSWSSVAGMQTIGTDNTPAAVTSSSSLRLLSGASSAAVTTRIDDDSAAAVASSGGAADDTAADAHATHTSVAGDADTLLLRMQTQEQQQQQQQQQTATLQPAMQTAKTIGVDVSLLSLSAEELHERRVQRSAAMGVQCAVQMQRDALAVEHKRRKLEGKDVRGRISSLLGKMRQQPDADATAATAVTPSPSPDSAAVARDQQQADGDVASLVFRPSSLAAGGYVLTKTTVNSSGGGGASGHSGRTGNRRALLGKPSSTLLLRYVRNSPLPTLLAACRTAVAEHGGGGGGGGNGTSNKKQSDAAASTMAAALLDELLAPLLEAVRRECGRYGVVRAVRAHVLRADDDDAQQQQQLQRITQRVRAAMAADRVGAVVGSPSGVQADKCGADGGGGGGDMDAVVQQRVLRERLRLFVRFDTVAAAFTAAEEMGKHAHDWHIAFTPTTAFDAGVLAPSEDEPLCTLADE